MTDLHQAGDDILLRLTVTPQDSVPTDGTTSVAGTVYLDGAAPRVLTPTPAGLDRSRWSALLTATPAGLHRVVWTVVGTGAGVQGFDLAVGPAPASEVLGRSYASTGALATYLGGPPPAGARALLRRATDRVDELLRTAVYDVDTAGAPTDSVVAAALAEATCAQVAWFVEMGEDGTGGAQRWSDVKIGSVQLSGAAPSGGDGAGRYAPAAVQALRKVPQLYGRAPRMPW